MSTIEMNLSAKEGEDLDKNPGTVSENSSHESETSKHPDLDSAPDGGLTAWLVVLGGATVVFCCLGFSNAFGVFEEYYLAHQLRDDPAEKVAWIGSLAAFMQFSTGVISGPLFDRLGAKIIRPAAIVYVFAMMMLSLCDKYWQIMIVQGPLMGIAMGFLQVPTFAAVAQYFNKKRGAALGLLVSGSSIGGVVMPILLSKMLNSSTLGFGWSVRVIGFMMIPLLGISCVTLRACLPPRATAFWVSSAFKQKQFLLLILALFFMFICMFMPLFYIPTYAVTRGMDATLASYLLAILNGSSTFGRIIPGALSDKFGKLNVFAAGGFATAIITFCMNKATSTASLIVYSILFGFTSGTIISGAAAAFSICLKDPRELGMYMGMGLAISASAALIGPPVSGVMVTHYGDFSQACIFSGVCGLFGSCVALASKAVTPQGILGRV